MGPCPTQVWTQLYIRIYETSCPQALNFNSFQHPWTVQHLCLSLLLMYNILLSIINMQRAAEVTFFELSYTT